MSYVEKAKLEFKAAGWIDGNGKWSDGMQKIMCDQVIELLELFSKHGHSGSSAPYAISLFKSLANHEPIVPLTGEDWEWEKIGENYWQNKRCYHVFKEGDSAYDAQGKIFREPNDCCYTNGNSHVDITFPYTPKREYVDVVDGGQS